MIRRTAIGLIALAIGLAGCGERRNHPAPPDIAYGRDICVACGMIISDPTSAAAYQVDGEDRIFDDIGDMVEYGTTSGELTQGTPAWVHDHDTGAWIDAAPAVFVASDTSTPMAHGIVAFAEPARAAGFIAEHGGTVVEWNTLLTSGLPRRNHP